MIQCHLCGLEAGVHDKVVNPQVEAFIEVRPESELDRRVGGQRVQVEFKILGGLVTNVEFGVHVLPTLVVDIDLKTQEFGTIAVAVVVVDLPVKRQMTELTSVVANRRVQIVVTPAARGPVPVTDAVAITRDVPTTAVPSVVSKCRIVPSVVERVTVYVDIDVFDVGI